MIDYETTKLLAALLAVVTLARWAEGGPW